MTSDILALHHKEKTTCCFFISFHSADIGLNFFFALYYKNVKKILSYYLFIFQVFKCFIQHYRHWKKVI